ncbi:DUF2341 domain-containing protein [Gracilimonas tropica]|uniref:DUF2341 domain-containing protein n=1 Tax=Gracilimonas tropica TaxID=454600 RepID=UPI000366BB3E|nr:DUF2341 domain-containing protein [Gracilimonas tropica]
MGRSKKFHTALFSLIILCFCSDVVWGQVSGYDFRKKYVVNESQVSGSTNLTNFPVLIEITDTDFRSTGNGGDVESPNGYDIIFTADDATTVLDHELVDYNASTGLIRFWVRFPTLNANTDTGFYIFYGNSSQTTDQSTASTWDSSYRMVLHLDSGTITDATVNGNNGTDNGTADIAGKIGRARVFQSANDDNIQIADDATLDITGDITISAWHRPDGFAGGPDLITKGGYQDSYGTWYDNNGQLRFQTNNNALNSTSNITNNQWNYITFTKSSSGRTIYINQNAAGSDANTTAFNQNNNPLFISTTQYPFNGSIDEVRISNVARSADWIATEYNNQNTPATFISETPDVPVLADIEQSQQIFISGGASVFVTSSLTISHPFVTELDSAKVEINTNFQSSEDVLAFTNQNGITGSWDSSTGVLSLSGTTTLANYQSALRAVTYENTNASSPDLNVQEISFTGYFSDDATNSVVRNVAIISTINDLSTEISNPVFHFDAQDINGDLNLGNQPGDGSQVATWGDRSDNAVGSGTDLSATNGTASNRPIFNSNYLGERGGILWDGTDDNLNLPSNALVNTGTSYDEKSFGVIFRTGASTNGLQVIYEQGNNEYGYQISIKDGIAYAYTYSYFFGFFPNDNSSINLGPVEPNESYIVVATHDATSATAANQTWKASINGGSVQTLTDVEPREDHASAPIIGEENSTRDPVTFANNPAGTNNFSGYIGEFASWNTAFSESEMISVYNYFCEKWCNEPPELSSIEMTNLDFTEGDSPASLTSTLTVSDSDNTVLDSAKVIISNNFDSSEDELSFTPVGNITGSYNSSTGVLLLTGQDSPANYQTALRSVTYENTSNAPSTALRDIDFIVYDWDDESNTQTRSVNVISVNSTPTLSGITGGVVTYNEGSGPVTGPFTVSISDDDPTMASATISISNNYILGEDELAFTDQNGITGNWNSFTGVLSLTGSSSIANYETALESVTYENSSSDPVELTRTISFTVNDGTSNSNTQSRDFDINAANSKPELSDLETSNVTYLGNPVEITAEITVSDPDDTQLDSAFVIISNNFDSSQDSLKFQNIFGITSTFNDVTGVLKLEGTASLEDYETALRTVIYDNFASVSSGPNREISFVAHDGELASDTLKRNINVNAVESINGLEVWLRADVGVVTSGSEVVTWQDQSGNNNDFTGVADANNRPTTVASSSFLNNQPAINFAGNGDHFEDSDGENYINGSSEFTIFLVLKSDLTNTDRGLFIAETPATQDKTLTIRYDAAGANNNGAFTNVVKTGILADNQANQLESFSDIQTTNGQIISYQWQSGQTYDIFIDGILNNPSAAGPPPTGTITGSTTAIVGKGGKDAPDTQDQSWDGQIAEFIYYDRLLTKPEREGVEDYLSDKYKLSIRKITVAEGGENISADDANSTYTPLTGPIIKEGFAGELSAGGTIVLEVPSGFEWNTGATPTVTTSAVYGGTSTLDVTFTSISATQVTLTVNTASASNPGEIDITGLEVRPTTGILPNTGDINNSGTTGLGGGTNYGTLTMVPGAVDSLVVIQQPSSTNLNTVISPSVRVQLTDQFGNEVKTAGTNVSIALSSGSGTLSGTTTTQTNTLGIAEFANLEIDETGTKRLTATSTGLDDAVTNTFQVVNAGVLTGFKIERVPSGNISQKFAGQNFNIKITAIDGIGDTITSFNGTVSVTSSCNLGAGQGTTPNFSSGVLSSLTVNITNVKRCTITATNSAGSESGTSNSFLVIPGPVDETQTSITASPTVILNDGSSTSAITVQAKDEFGNIIDSGGETVALSTTLGSIGGVTDNGDGTYSATLTSSTSTGIATISGTLNGDDITDEAEVEFASFSHIWESQLGSLSDASNYFDPDNWNVNSVPNASSVVLIPANPAVGNEFPAVSQTDTEIAELSIEASAELNVAGGINFIVSGDVTGNGQILGSNNDSLTVGGNLNISEITLGTVIFNGNTDQEIVSPTDFINLELDNPNTLTISENLTVNGLLTLTDGELLIPSGINLLASNLAYGSGNLRFQRRISGVRGWRMLSSPVNSTFGDFLDGTLTQGYTGATYSTGSNPGDTLQPNVMWYLEDYDTNVEGLPATDNDRLRAPANATNSVAGGRGYWVYFFGNIPADPLYNDPLPDTLDVAGQEFGSGSSEFDFGVTYTPSADSGWNFVGNPFGAAINWDDNANWTKTNMESTIYIWDPAANNGNGEFLTWNGSTGSLGSGIIPPFQGFWVKANGPGPELIVDTEAKTTGGNFLRKEAPESEKKHQDYENYAPVIALRASGEELTKQTFIMGGKNASIGKDMHDALRLVPFSDTHIEFYSTLENGTELAINNIPREFEYRQNIPLHFAAFRHGRPEMGQFTISRDMLRNVPEEWLLILIDNDSGKQIDLRENASYTFSYNSDSKLFISSPSEGAPVKRSNLDRSRFVLRLTTEEIEANIPEEFYLYQNYPNPFNPTTTIPFGLTEESDVRLEVFDILGRKVHTLVSEKMPAGRHTISFRAGSLASGLYLYRIITNDNVRTKKMLLIK